MIARCAIRTAAGLLIGNRGEGHNDSAGADETAGEAMVLSCGVRILVDSVEGRRVRLAIEAPGHKRIMREELVGTPTPERVQRVRERMAAGSPL